MVGGMIELGSGEGWTKGGEEDGTAEGTIADEGIAADDGMTADEDGSTTGIGTASDCEAIGATTDD